MPRIQNFSSPAPASLCGAAAPQSAGAAGLARAQPRSALCAQRLHFRARSVPDGHPSPQFDTMAPKSITKVPDKLTDAEKKKVCCAQGSEGVCLTHCALPGQIKQENKAKANPKQAEAKKEKARACLLTARPLPRSLRLHSLERCQAREPQGERLREDVRLSCWALLCIMLCVD